MKIVHLCLGSFYIDNYSYQENILPKHHKLLGNDISIIASTQTFDKNGKLTYMTNKLYKYVSSDGISVTRLPFLFDLSFCRFLKIYKGLWRELNRISPDILFIHNFQFLSVLIVYFYAIRNVNVKVNIDNHADYFNSAKSKFSMICLHKIIWRLVAFIIHKRINIFFGVTPWRCLFLNDVYKIPKDKIELLVMGVDDSLDLLTSDEVQKLKYKYNMTKNQFVIVTGGKIDLAKNIHLLMDAVEQIENQSVNLYIFGVFTDEVKSIFDSRNHDRIHFLGWKTPAEINELLQLADLTCFPGTHSVLWEQSVGLGKIGIFKKWPNMDHVNINGNCILLDDVTVESIKESILSLFENEMKLYIDMNNKAQNEAKKHFSYSEIAIKALK